MTDTLTLPTRSWSRSRDDAESRVVSPLVRISYDDAHGRATPTPAVAVQGVGTHG